MKEEKRSIDGQQRERSKRDERLTEEKSIFESIDGSIVSYLNVI